MQNITPDGPALLQTALNLWMARSGFREDRRRNKRYTYGSQWDDIIEVRGRRISEAQYIKEQGSIPLKNNLIRRLVRSVLGVYRARRRQPVCHALDEGDDALASRLTSLLHTNAHLNRLDELYARSLEEYLISGFVVHRKWYGPRNGVTDCWTDSVEPDAFFMDTSSRDFRAWDIRAVGQLHDLPFDDLASAFASSPAGRARLRDIYMPLADDASPPLPQWGFADSQRAFFTPPAGMCRVIEIWRRENDAFWLVHDPAEGSCRRVEERDYDREVTAAARRRSREGLPPLVARHVSQHRWRYYYLAPSGEVLRHGDSPYRAFGHPYVVKAYPYIDGEIHSFVADIIDQQRYTNRLITLYDWVMRASAKGVLLFPEDSLPDGVELQDIADEWARFNGVIMFRPIPGVPLPQQVSGNSANLGITELLNIQMKLLEDVSGVNGAIQGRLDSGQVSGTLFSQQTRNSLTALLDIIESFDAFTLDAACRDAANICAFSPAPSLSSFRYDLHLSDA